ncbi:alpha/beta hydrolase [Nocardioides sp.]|uniref:alpha/beta hydrolase n=1 Tax=Nocardioides sp. TaxID=35761 RepID=UPI002734A74A|nr:alpha/beta hydrolase [Nocardioides sp.]MDP3894293.1 alpha/beta hydrolase [Nocardioides sp.]
MNRAQGPLLRGALALPARVQRVLAGRPITLEGQQLDVEAQLVLRMQRSSGLPATEELPIPEGRAMLATQAAIMGGDLPIGEVRDLEVNGHPARLYVPRSRGVSPGVSPRVAAEPGDRAGTGDPLLVFFHGGGWIYGDLSSHDGTCRFLAERAGVRVLSVEYSLAPEQPFPAAYDDCLAAFRWVTEHTDELGADRGRLAVGGDSAGGCLAATTAIEAAREGLPLAFQLLIYPATELTRSHESHRTFGEGFYLTTGFMDLGADSYLPDPDDRTDPRASPFFADLPAGLAPAYVCTAGFDPLRDEGEAYARKLADAGVDVELKRFPSMIHGFINWVGLGRSCPAYVAEVADALRTGLRAG